MRILLVKSAGVQATWEILGRLGEEFPGAELDLWTEEREFQPFHADPRVAQVLFYRHLDDYPAFWRLLRQRPYDLIALVLNREPTYGKFRTLAMLLPAGRMRGYDESGRAVDIGWRTPGNTWRLARGHVAGQNANLGEGLAGFASVVLRLVLRLLRGLARLILAPFVIAWLLARAAVIHANRRSRMPGR